MAVILIVDENTSVGVLLKRELKAHGHQVFAVDSVENPMFSSILALTDLIMINKACKNDSGWDIFNKLDDGHQSAAAMVYVLESWSQISVRWIIAAAQEALKCRKAVTYKRDNALHGYRNLSI
jgi:DNA-binding response OmpR family regulator